MKKTQHQKWNESDFEFVLEDMEEDKDRHYQIEKGRLLDKPKRHRNISLGATSKSYVICFHGRFLAENCGACEFEVPRISQRESA